MEDLQARAGEIIAEITGAEAGYVVPGAAAGLTLATAACLAGLAPVAMDQLPETDGRHEVIIQRAHRNAYDHAIRLAGARIVDVGYLGFPGAGITYPWQIEAAITERTVAIAHPVMHAPGTVPLEETVTIAHRHGLPVIVDAAAALPPVENLRRFIAAGADLVTFSGGKAIGGPQASGILCGRRELIESVALQQQDMDVHPATWTLRRAYLETGRAHDHAADGARWHEWLAAMTDVLVNVPGVRPELRPAQPGGRPYPVLAVWLDAEVVGLTAIAVANTLAEGEPPVLIAQGLLDDGAITINPTQLTDEHAGLVLERLLAALGA
jgi:L-seryl-tRNA(Ser) seleniumtransferase